MNKVKLSIQEENRLKAISLLPGKVIGWSKQAGIYELCVLASGGSNEPTVLQALGRNRFELVKNGEENYFRYSFVSFHIRNLMGEILTTLEASITDERQLNAAKSIVKNYFGRKLDWLYENAGVPEDADEQEMIGEE